MLLQVCVGISILSSVVKLEGYVVDTSAFILPLSFTKLLWAIVEILTFSILLSLKPPIQIIQVSSSH